MIFNSIAYFLVFLLPAALLFRRVPVAFRPWICSIVGAAFFVYFSLTTAGGPAGAVCLALLLWQIACCVYFCKPGSRLCLAVVVQSVLCLCAFKYLNFFGGLFFGGHPERSPLYWRDAFLPLGISFFTFEFIHFAVDRYNRKIAGAVSLADFMAFILFFPTMVAGPIKRFQDFEPKMLHPSTDWPLDFNRGITRILYGLAKKFAVADLLTAVTDHLNAHDIQSASGRGALLVWLLAYGFKIYFDFSAYSDIAIGSARLFGIKVPENFSSPYTKTNIADFWQHWHISLYRWLVDYVFIPLGGSRVSPIFVYRNLILVMLASGLWHGAGLNFIAWGAWHAALLCIHRVWSRRPAGLAHTAQIKAAQEAGLPVPETALGVKLASWALTFTTVNLGWAFFAMNWETSMVFFHRLIMG